jgi:Tol biopolymer transport system component
MKRVPVHKAVRATAVMVLVVVQVVLGCAPIAASDRSRLEAKMKQVQTLAPRWAESGGDPNRIAPLGNKVDEALKAGRLDEAEKIVDQILAIVTGPPDSGSTAGRPAPAAQATAPRLMAGRFIGTPRTIDIRALPGDADIIFWSTRYDRRRGDTPSLGPSELYVLPSGGGPATQVTFDNPQFYEHVAVSFDRTKIAADRYLSQGVGEVSLWVLDIPSRTEVRLVPDFYSAGNGGVDWSPDGYIYFSGMPTRNGEREIFRIKPDGTGLTQLTFSGPSNPGAHFDVSVSADGSLVAYVRMVRRSIGGRQGPKTEIWVMNADGSQPRRVYDGGTEIGMAGKFPVGAYDPEISSDNRQVVFSVTNTAHNNFRSSLNMAHDLYIANLDGSGLRRITTPGAICVIPDWRDGTIIYTEYNEKDRYVGLIALNSDGSARRPLDGGLPKMWDGGMNGKFIPRKR